MRCFFWGGSDKGDKNASKLEKLVKSSVTFLTTAAQKFSEHELKSEVHESYKVDTFLKVMQSKVEPALVCLIYSDC